MPLFKSTSRKFPRFPRIASDIPYVLRIEFRNLERATSTITGKPIACYKCNAFLTDPSQILDDGSTGKYFICPFCGTLNVVEGEIIIASDNVDVIISGSYDTSTDSTISIPPGKSFLAILDLSGSMSGVSLAAVKRSLSSSIDSLLANSPETMFGLVTFESRVCYNDITMGELIELPEDFFFSIDAIIGATEKIVDMIRLVNIETTAASIKHHLQSLTARGITALGPSLVFAYVIAKHYRVSRIVLLTDGLANLGIGSFEGVQAVPPKQFYSTLAKWFFEIGTTIDVVGIASSSGLEMRVLGILPDITNGQIYYVTPNELDQSMAELAGAEVLGRDVEVRIITPSWVAVRDVSGISEASASLFKKVRSTKIGAVGGNHEMCVEVAPEMPLTVEKVPIQVQVEYTDNYGARRVRTMTTTLPVAHDEDELMAEMDPTVSATFVTQKAGAASFGGSIENGRQIISSFRKALKKRAKSASADLRVGIEEVDAALSDEERGMLKLEEEIEQAPPTAQAQVADVAYTASLKQKRRSSEELFKKRKKDGDKQCH